MSRGAARRGRAPGLVMAALATVAAVLLAGCGLEQDLGSRDLTSSPATTAPPLSGTMLDGTRFDLATHRGHIVVIDFWASWCGPCHKQQPELDKLATRFIPRGLTFAGVDMRDDKASGRAYIAEFGVPYSSIEDSDGAITAAFDIPAPPETIVIDGSGHIVFRRLGGITEADLAPTLEHLLASAAPSVSRP